MDAPRSVFRPEMLAGRVYIVTGGSTGIGFAVVRELLSCGAACVACGKDWEKLREAARILASEALGGGGKLLIQRCDIRAPDQAAALVKQTLKTFGKLDGLVNNAGGQFASLLEDVSVRGMRSVVDLNLLGTWNMTKAAFDIAWRPSGRGGVIVNIAMDTHSFPMLAHSAASRAGVCDVAWEGRGERAVHGAFSWRPVRRCSR
jgi:citronellol/citronellal dehydrogenase